MSASEIATGCISGVLTASYLVQVESQTRERDGDVCFIPRAALQPLGRLAAGAGNVRQCH